VAGDAIEVKQQAGIADRAHPGVGVPGSRFAVELLGAERRALAVVPMSPWAVSAGNSCLIRYSGGRQVSPPSPKSLEGIAWWAWGRRAGPVGLNEWCGMRHLGDIRALTPMGCRWAGLASGHCEDDGRIGLGA
jgi:hypothetical protein